jgi:hypothetical protein
VALIHLIAGSERKVIVEDYLRSNDELIPYFKKIMMMRAIISLGFFPYSTVIFAIRVKQKNIESVLDRVTGYREGIEGYLGTAGFDTSKLTGFRKRLLINDKK